MPRPTSRPTRSPAERMLVAPPFDCSWTDGGLNAAWVHLAGELDVDTTPQLEQTLRDPHSQAPLVVLDMRELAFMDSSGVHAIVNAGARARQARPPAGDPARAAGRRPRLRADRQHPLRRERRARPGRPVRPGAPAAGRRGRPLMSATAPSRGAAETVPIEHESFDRVVRTLVFGVPPVALAVAGWLAWGGTLHWHDLVVLAITYTLTGLGITVGYHRLFTHRSFKTSRTVRAVLAVLGSMAVEGPVIEWVATHRKHHRFSDQHGDPHSPHVDQAPGWRGTLRGLAHAHVGWMFRGKDMANPAPLRQGPARRPRPALHQPHLPPVGRGRAGHPVRPGLRAERLARGRAHRAAVGRRGAGADPAPHDLQHQLAVPRLRPAAVRHRRRVAQPRGWPRSPSARPGTTTTTRSRPRLVTASAAASSTSAPGSSPASSAATWPGTSSGSAPDACRPARGPTAPPDTAG